jgi:predicted secreted hydrolase
MSRRHRIGQLATIAAAAILVAGCAKPILANDPIVFPSPPMPTSAPSHAPDPVPIILPRDDGPHDRLTEWWYYTGHLRTTNGRRFGFEAVVFRAERGSVSVAWAAHLALTDEAGERFVYAQRSEVGPQVDHPPRDASGTPTGFDLQVSGLSPRLIAAGAPPVATPWRLSGANGTDRIEAALSPEEAAASGASFGLQLDLEATKPPALHDGDGFVDFGPAGSSYYYSRTRLAATGTLELDGARMTVDGIAWFDHQWGDFVSVGAGGWNWFAINLDDGVDLTISEVLAADGTSFGYGTLVDQTGAVQQLTARDFEISASRAWRSERTGRLYPSDWHLTIPTLRSGDELTVALSPTVADQELDTRASTGVIYWEGSQTVSATYRSRYGRNVVSTKVGGEAYVEITRYGP